MFIDSSEWRAPDSENGSALCRAPTPKFEHAPLYRSLLAQAQPDTATQLRAAQFLQSELAQVADGPSGLPKSPQDLTLWMQACAVSVHAQYRQYLEQRRAGVARRFFFNRAHALYFLRLVAPTKLVDGAWLHGVLADAGNPRLVHLVQTYLEELGSGEPAKNHVALYRGLLARHGLESFDDVPDPLYRQGLIQLALGCNTQQYLPEVIGFNLGYEQLPLHLLITAYELDELGIDPYYFTLHVTVDNSDTGHARRACEAVLDNLPRFDDGGTFWRRIREGSKLAGAGVGTEEVIASFTMETEVLQILSRKALAGAGAHSDYCRIAGRTVNEWLSSSEGAAAFVEALQHAGWIKRGEDAQNSRFWNLLQGERAPMFGVFAPYELQVLHDWIRGDASADGRPYFELPGAQERRLSFRASARRAVSEARRVEGKLPDADCSLAGVGCMEFATDINLSATLDVDWHLLEESLWASESKVRQALLLQALSPAQHWTPAGMRATRMFCEALPFAP
ncbi:MAG: iron-containing redox enzyme family protein [Burkholderiaceae bacterium]